jgi:putative ABC transport system permease protein
VRHRLSVLIHGGAYEREMDEEMQFHLALEAMQQATAARGRLSGEEARFAARRHFGNVTYLKEETRRMAGLGFLEVARQDLRFALRTFRRTPGFTAVAVLTLAIGIGANTAIFSAVNVLLLRPLPFRDPARLMKVSLTKPARPGEPANDDVVWSYPKFVAFRNAQRVYSELGLYADGEVTLSGGGEPERVFFENVGGDYLKTLGVQPVVGRGFVPEEDQTPGGRRVVLLSHELWTRRYNADLAMLGRAIDIDGQPHTVVGVLPSAFRGLSGRAVLWVPIAAIYPGEMVEEEAWSHSWTLIARLRQGVSPAQAKQVVPLLGARVDEAYPYPGRHGEHWGATARELDATRVDPVVRRSLLVLMSAVVLVLLIACANVANLFLVRASARGREIAVRLAVGAGRGRLVRQLLTESVLLAVLGGGASVALAWWGVMLLRVLQPGDALRMQRLAGLGAVSFASIHLDLAAFGFAAGLAVATGLLFGLVPAIQATRPSLTSALAAGASPSRAGGGVRRITSWSVLAVVEIALAVVLLAGSGLMLRSLAKLLGVNPGFDARDVLTLRLNLADDGSRRDSMPGFYAALLERLGALPGVTGVALGDCPPLNGGCNSTILRLRDRLSVASGTDLQVGVHWVTPGWFTVLHVPLERGRAFTSGDRLGSQKVVLVSETAARTFWPGEDAVGRPVSVGQGGFGKDTAYVVGVVGDVRFATLDSLPKPDVYLSYYQSPRTRMMLYARTAVNPSSVTPAARRAIREIAPSLPAYDVRTMEARVADSAGQMRFSAVLLAMFAAAALTLATMGIYGVISYAVSLRRREIGIRMALGAASGDVLGLVVGQGAVLAAAGATIGVVVALAATRVVRSLLFEVAPNDPATFAAVVGLLAGAAVLATWIPARRATRVSPTEALREG